ncbi:ABC transporter ATP-binding protein [Borrelia coriaceae ATCC 43381]|uniref:ABC transporter ATP-binding protein n=1 Tax=Borrelia coriaceae ATCC 43381 TaxID=1408429 RepID=W5SVQ9_9SPIR|nr:ABC transporter ATP-binding protein [Borrelia coriaceae ATCC 43381]
MESFEFSELVFLPGDFNLSNVSLRDYYKSLYKFYPNFRRKRF